MLLKIERIVDWPSTIFQKENIGIKPVSLLNSRHKTRTDFETSMFEFKDIEQSFSFSIINSPLIKTIK
jgi:hypothetical protein